MANNLFTIINPFYFIVSNLYTIINKLFTQKNVFLLIVSKVHIKLNKNPKVGYFCTKPLTNLGMIFLSQGLLVESKKVLEF